MRFKPQVAYFSAILLLISITLIGNVINRHQSLILFLTYAIGFMGYWIVANSNLNLKLVITISLIARVVLFFSLPSLSDDIFRFIWDGTLLKNGIHPFENLPDFYVDKEIDGITSGLYDRLNSKQYFTIYPPINQFIFWLSAIVGNGNFLISTNFIRLLILIGEALAFFYLNKLIKHNNLDKKILALYFLNPLIILEFVGNLHFEALVICFLIIGVYFFQINSKWKSALGFGLAIGTKLIPLIFLPYLFFIGLKNQKWQIAILAGLIGVLTLIPLVNESFISGMQNSLSLYFKSFEFNASIYYLIREIGFWVSGYNLISQIGPSLSIISGLSILVVSYFMAEKEWSLVKGFLVILVIYLLFTTSVHPWYITPILIISLLNNLKFGVIWSFTVIVTYLGYSVTGFDLPLYFVAIEYLIVTGFFIYEFKKLQYLK